MQVESLTSYDYYIDEYEEVSITISSTSNPTGTINVDDNGNRFGKSIHSGSNFLHRLDYNLSNPIIIYDDVNYVYLDSSYTEQDVFKHYLIKPLRKIMYKPNASKIESPTVDGDKLLIDMTQKNVFKIMINGNTVENYTSVSDGINILAPDNYNITGINDDIIVYLYDDSTEIVGDAVFYYTSPNTLIPTMDNVSTYLDNNGYKLDYIETTNVNITKNNEVINTPYKYPTIKDEASRDSILSLNMFEDIRDKINYNEFRIFAYDRLHNKVKIFSNCRWQEGESISIQKSKNDYSYDVNFEDEIKVEYIVSENKIYGSGIYGNGYYGGEGIIYENVRL